MRLTKKITLRKKQKFKLLERYWSKLVVNLMIPLRLLRIATRFKKTSKKKLNE